VFAEQAATGKKYNKLYPSEKEKNRIDADGGGKTKLFLENTRTVKGNRRVRL